MKLLREYPIQLLLIVFLLLSTMVLYWPKGTAAEKERMILSDLPMTLGDWTAKEVQLSDEVLSILGAQDYLMREYVSDNVTLTLYITYFNTGSGALTHNPEKCYTASGWTFLDKSTIDLPGDGQKTLQSTVAKGDLRQIVLYWYQDGNRVLISKFKHISSVLWKAILGRGMHSLVASVSAPVDGVDAKELTEVLTVFSGLVMDALAEQIPQE